MTNNLPLDTEYAYGKPSARAKFRTELLDFIVVEQLGFELADEGEHLCLEIKKRGENTQWVADKLAKFLNVKSMDVGFCGMKDRHAETTQWFSVYLPREPEDTDWNRFKTLFELDVEILRKTRHTKKLRRGAHQGNAFKICLRDLLQQETLEERLRKISEHGVPNYFGEQRFGRGGNNLTMAHRWLVDGETIRNRSKRSMAMSAARSYLFNLVLSERVKQNNWFKNVDGDVVENGCATAPLWGRGRSKSTGAALALETEALAPFSRWCDQLEHVGLHQERRSLQLMPKHFCWDWQDSSLTLSFVLPPGQFATSVLREICLLDNQSY